MSSASQQTILVTAGGGNIGKRLIPLLLQDPTKPKIILPTSNAARLSQSLSTPQSSQLAIEEGDIQDPQWFQHILTTHNVTSVFLCLTGENELIVTLNIFDAMLRAGCVRHLVYLSACGNFSLPAIMSDRLLQGVSAGHVVVKFITEAKLQYGLPAPPPAGNGFTYTVIGPALFFDNDLRSKRNMLDKGLFDEPIGSKGVSRVAPSDIALAVYKSLVHDRGEKYGGRKIMIGSRKTYTGEEIAALWSKALGKRIAMEGTDAASLDAFEGRIRTVRSSGWARDMRLMYEIFAAKEFGMSDEDYETQVRFLGKEPESYEEFVANTAQNWLQESK